MHSQRYSLFNTVFGNSVIEYDTVNFVVLLVSALIFQRTVLSKDDHCRLVMLKASIVWDKLSVSSSKTEVFVVSLIVALVTLQLQVNFDVNNGNLNKDHIISWQFYNIL